MVRNRVRKSERGTHSREDMEKGLKLVSSGWKIRAAARQVGVNYKTLGRYFNKMQHSKSPAKMKLTSTYNHSQVFSAEIEEEIATFVKERSVLGYGLTMVQVHELAYEMAVANNIKTPKSWEKTSKAGRDWFLAFMKRNPTLSCRSPEQCSVARAAAFNKPTIEAYYKKLDSALDRHPQFRNGQRVFNCDETATSTVGNLKKKIVSVKGVKQMHQVKGQERGTTVTTLFFISALGTFLPPVMIFPRVNFNNGMLKDCFPNTLGLANKSGWMTKEMFVLSLKQFIIFANCSKENLALLIVDNLLAHISVEAIRLCRENGIILFTLPPHTTHKTQPLDVGVFGPFKNSYDHAVHLWTLNNPGKPATIYEVAGFVNTAARASMTPSNILSAFKATGISPFNDKIFSDHDFVMSQVTFEPLQPAAQVEESQERSGQNELEDPMEDPDNPPVTPAVNDKNKRHVSPTDILGIPHATPKKPTKSKRRKGRCMIATDTPEKNEIEKIEEEKKKKEDLKILRQKLIEQRKCEKSKKKKSKSKPKRQKKAARNIFPVESSEEENDEDCILSDDEKSTLKPDNFAPLTRKPEEGEYVLVEFASKDTVYYVGKILSEEDKEGDLQISYLRRADKINYKFVLPEKPDLKSVHINDVKLILPKPTTSGTKRQQGCLNFAIDLSFFKVL